MELLIAAGILVGLIGLGFLTGILQVVSRIGLPMREFESKEWLAHPEHDGADTIRRQMSDDLVDSHLPVGTTRKRVVILLGPPTSSDRSADSMKTDRYTLATERGEDGAPIAIELVIEYDSQDKLREATCQTQLRKHR